MKHVWPLLGFIAFCVVAFVAFCVAVLGVVRHVGFSKMDDSFRTDTELIRSV